MRVARLRAFELSSTLQLDEIRVNIRLRAASHAEQGQMIRARILLFTICFFFCCRFYRHICCHTHAYTTILEASRAESYDITHENTHRSIINIFSPVYKIILMYT